MDQWIQQLDSLLHTEWVVVTITAVLILVATFIVSRLVAKLLRAVLQKVDDKVLPKNTIFINIARGAVWIIGICVILATCFEQDVSAVVAAIGIGGLALSLGFQDTVSNLIGGLQMSLMKILKPGDHIQVGSDSGIVKDVTWRHTSISNRLGQTVIIPNAVINKTALIKLPPYDQVSINFIVHSTGTDLDVIAKEIEEACVCAAVPISKITQEPEAFFTEVTDFGFRGKVIFRIADANQVGAVSDAALRLIAPLTRPDTNKKR